MELKVVGNQNQKYITIPNPICKLKNIEAGTKADLQIKGKKIIITVECDS